MIDGLRKVGDKVWFEYHCKESHQSSDAIIWYHSHQQVTILAGPSFDDEPLANEKLSIIPPTLRDRAETAMGLMYRVRWNDGLEYDVFEDELLDCSSEFYRPNPSLAIQPSFGVI